MCNQEKDIKVSHNITNLEFFEAYNQWNKFIMKLHNIMTKVGK